MFLLNSQSSDVCIPWAFDILLLENSQKIYVLIYRMFDISLKPEHCLLLADHNLLLSSQVFKRENEPAIFYFYLITSINKSDRYSNGKMNLQMFTSCHLWKSIKKSARYSNGKMNLRMFTFHHLWKSIKICQVLKRENEPAIFSHFTIFENL